MNNVAIEMCEFKYNFLKSLIDRVKMLQASYDVLSEKMMEIQNDSNSSFSEFNTVMNEIQDNITERNRILLELGENVFSNLDFFDIVKKGDADE